MRNFHYPGNVLVDLGELVRHISYSLFIEYADSPKDIIGLYDYTRSVIKLGLTAHHLNSTTALKFLAIVRLLRVILPCCETKMMHINT